MTNEERVQKFKDLNIAINCEIEQEAKKFIDWCYDNGMKFSNGKKLILVII